MREFVTGHGTPLATIAKEPSRRDVRFVMLTVLVFGVMVNFGFAIHKLWGVLAASRYAPTPLVILVALALTQPYFWFLAASERAALKRRTVEMSLDPVVVEIALRALYRGLFLCAMTALLFLFALHQLLPRAADLRG